MTSCQNEKKLNGTWISSYKFSDNDSIKNYVVGDFPFNQLITFNNGTFSIKEFKYDSYDNERTEQFELNGNRIKIIKAKKVLGKGIPGTILDDNLTIACSKNAIRIVELKREGKQKMTADEFLRGNKIKTGQNLH